MARIYKVLRALFVLALIAMIPLALVLSHDSACGPVPSLSSDITQMKAIVQRCYGTHEVLSFEDVAKPVPADDQVLIKVHAASVNPLDWHYMHGTPYIMRLDSGIGTPKSSTFGVDFSGTIEAVGKSVKSFKPGDEVFGGRSGAFAEYVVVREAGSIVLKPANLTFEQSASMPIAAVTALQALRDKGRIAAGQKVLINGASGGVGSFAVQIAKSFGAEVTGVCSTRNVELVKSLGADFVIDYTKENFTEGDKHYDLIVDMVGNHALLDARRALTPNGNFVIVGGPDGNWLGPMAGPIKAMFLSPFVDQEFGMMLAEMNQKDLGILRDLVEAGKVTPVIDKTYTLSEVPQALEYLETGRARGKVVIVIQPDHTP
jgi:NADPH:quinone reductase-like Zn-dependent oxidoreductase